MIAGVIPAAAGVAAAGALALGIYYPNSWLFGRVIGRGPREGKTAYLTFDDGPNPRRLTASWKRWRRRVCRRRFSWSERTCSAIPTSRAASSRLDTRLATTRSTHQAACARPTTDPLGARGSASRDHHPRRNDAAHVPRPARIPQPVRRARDGASRLSGVWLDIRGVGLRAARRGRNPTTRARTLAPGAIVLLHDGDGYDPLGDRSQTATALPGIIEDARNAGYSLRPLGELLS